MRAQMFKFQIVQKALEFNIKIEIEYRKLVIFLAIFLPA